MQEVLQAHKKQLPRQFGQFSINKTIIKPSWDPLLRPRSQLKCWDNLKVPGQYLKNGTVGPNWAFRKDLEISKSHRRKYARGIFQMILHQAGWTPKNPLTGQLLDGGVISSDGFGGRLFTGCTAATLLFYRGAMAARKISVVVRNSWKSSLKKKGQICWPCDGTPKFFATPNRPRGNIFSPSARVRESRREEMAKCRPSSVEFISTGVPTDRETSRRHVLQAEEKVSAYSLRNFS